MMNYKQVLSFALVMSLLAACGAGSEESSAPQSVDVQAEAQQMAEAAAAGNGAGSAANGLLISEVSRTDYPSQPGWFEIYNAGTTAVSLSSVMVRSGSCDYDTACDPTKPKLFALPAVKLEPKAFVIVGGQPAADVTRVATPQNISLRDGAGSYPYWQSANGFVELVSADKTLDFVRFGSSPVAPLTRSAWSGKNAPAIDAASNNYDRVLVRAIVSASKPPADSNKASDWAAVSWSTPAGQNDVLASAKDEDKDGIPDSAEVVGGTFAGLNIHAMGARKGTRDIFVEVDYMPSADPATTPRKEALDKVVAAFAKRNIALHFDAGSLYGQPLNSGHNLGGGNALPFAECVSIRDKEFVPFFPGGVCSNPIYGYKRSHFDSRRQPIFHYFLMASSLRADGLAGPSGIGELPGNDFIVSLGGWGLRTDTSNATNTLISFQAGTIMHELGHNLGLHHGGNDEVNHKPNYYSVMNYLYQTHGLAADPTDWGVMDRIMLVLYWPSSDPRKPATLCDMANSPCSTDFIIDYSNGTGASFDENALDESKLIGRGAKPGVYADWNFNRRADRSVMVDLDGDEWYSKMSDFNDWDNLRLDVRDDFEHVTGTNMHANSVRKRLPGNRDESAPHSHEKSPTERLLKDIRSAR